MPARGRYSVKKKEYSTDPCELTTGTHETNEQIYLPSTLYYSSTAVRSTAVTPTKRSTHPT